MALREIDEAEYNQLTALRGVAAKIVANPAARRRLEEAHKMVDPNAVTPALDADRNLNEPLTALKTELTAELAALKKEREDEKRDARLAKIAAEQEADFRRLRTERRYTDEGIEKIRALMESKGLIDVHDAVTIFERDNPPQQLAVPTGGMTGVAWNFAGPSDTADQSIKDLIASKGANDQIADRMVRAALNDFRGGR